MANDLVLLVRRLVALERQIKQMQRSTQLAFSSIHDGGVNEYAQDVFVSRYGRQFDDTHGAVSLNGPTPPTPSQATGETYPGGGIIARWNGLWADPDVITPLDFTRVEVHASTVDSFTPDTTLTLYGTIESPRGGTVICLVNNSDDPYYIKLVARSSPGLASVGSLASEGVMSGESTGPILGSLEARVTVLEGSVEALISDVSDLEDLALEHESLILARVEIENPIISPPGSSPPTDDFILAADGTTGLVKWRAESGGGGLSTEDVQDIVGALVAGGTGITPTYNDAGAALTLALHQALIDMASSVFVNDDVVQKKAGVIRGRSVAQLLVDLLVAGAADTTTTRMVPRLSATTTIALNTFTPDLASFENYSRSAISAAFTFANPTGSPTTGQRLCCWFRSSAGTARTITRGSKVVQSATGGPAQAAATPASATLWLYEEYVYNATLDKWVLATTFTA